MGSGLKRKITDFFCDHFPESPSLPKSAILRSSVRNINEVKQCDFCEDKKLLTMVFYVTGVLFNMVTVVMAIRSAL